MIPQSRDLLRQVHLYPEGCCGLFRAETSGIVSTAKLGYPFAMMYISQKSQREIHKGRLVQTRGYCRKGLLLIMLVLVSPAHAQDQQPARVSYTDAIWDYLTNGSSLTMGIGGREADLTVKRLSDNATGKLVQRNQRSYFLSYSTRPAFFADSHFGYDFMFNLSSFHMDQQATANNTYLYLGTGGSGKFAYVVPTLFYLWGNLQQGTYLKAGIGIGAGIATFDGNIILTDSATQDNVYFSHKTTDLHLASSLILEGRWNNWGFLLSAAGPNMQQDGYSIQVTDISLNVGYRYIF
jgi:hypothetical protein